MTLYDSYRDARAKGGGEAFWTDVDLAMTVGVANVADHNHQLQSRISGHIVPEELTADSARRPASFAWIGNKQIESDLTLLTEHFIQADQASDQVETFRHGNLGDYESAKQFNQLIYTYWALVLGAEVRFEEVCFGTAPAGIDLLALPERRTRMLRTSLFAAGRASVGDVCKLSG